MLAKVPGKRGDGRSSFSSLAKYIGNERDHIEPVTGEVTRRDVSMETNCVSLDTAWSEMWAVSGQNPRVKDPVYHVVLAWQPGEVPTDKQAFEAARAAMKAVGMEGHQYVAAMHRDREHHHVHLMVNRVDPETYRAVYPDRDYFKLDQCMREVELAQEWRHSVGPYAVHERDRKKVVDWAKSSAQEWRQEKVDRRVEKTPTKARQMEAMTGNESLATYAQGEPKKAALHALKAPGADWQRFHASLAEHGLGIQPKGQGFAIHSLGDPQQTPIKASTMAQELGAGKLQKQLGPFQERAPERVANPPKITYNENRPKRDLAQREDLREQRAQERLDLRDRYRSYAAEWREAKSPARVAMYEQQRAERAELIDRHRSTRDIVRRSGLPSVEKKALYSVAALNAASEREALNDAIKMQREAFRSERPNSYRDWTVGRAQEGDRAAISQVRGWAYTDKRDANLMRREEAAGKRGPHLGTESSQDLDPAKPRRITERVSWSVDRKTGAVDYQVDRKAAFRDQGPRLAFNGDSARNHDAIEMGLRLASEKFGKIKVYGNDDAFADVTLMVAVERDLDVRFSDPKLESRRQEMVQAKRDQLYAQERATASPRKPEVALPPMTAAQREAALKAPEPTINRELVEAAAVERVVAAYRTQQEQVRQEQLGPRPDPEVGGFIEKMRARKAADKWDLNHVAHQEQLSMQVDGYREKMRGDDPKAVAFREDAWTKAKSAHAVIHAEWRSNQVRATSEIAGDAAAERAARVAKIKGLESTRTQQEAERVVVQGNLSDTQRKKNPGDASAFDIDL